MNPVENHGDWMKGISGSRRMTSEATIENQASIEEMTREPQRGQQGTALMSANDLRFAGSTTQAGKGIWARFGWGWNAWQRGDRPHLMAMSETGPVDWLEAIRGILFFGTLATAVWLEWIAIKAIATYFAAFL